MSQKQEAVNKCLLNQTLLHTVGKITSVRTIPKKIKVELPMKNLPTYLSLFQYSFSGNKTYLPGIGRDESLEISKFEAISRYSDSTVAAPFFFPLEAGEITGELISFSCLNRRNTKLTFCSMHRFSSSGHGHRGSNLIGSHRWWLCFYAEWMLLAISIFPTLLTKVFCSTL
jgi:hypothetical protein